MVGRKWRYSDSGSARLVFHLPDDPLELTNIVLKFSWQVGGRVRVAGRVNVLVRRLLNWFSGMRAIGLIEE